VLVDSFERGCELIPVSDVARGLFHPAAAGAAPVRLAPA